MLRGTDKKKDALEKEPSEFENLAAFYQALKPKATGTMENYFQWVMVQVKDLPYESAGSAIENLLSLNNEMTKFIEDLTRMVKAAAIRPTNKLIAFYRSEMPSTWSQKKMVFDVTGSENITKQDAGKIYFNRNEIMKVNCVKTVVTANAKTMLEAKTLLDIYEVGGWEAIAAIVLSQDQMQKSEAEKLLIFQQTAMILTLRELMSSKQLANKSVFAQPKVQNSDQPKPKEPSIQAQAAPAAKK